MGFDTIEYNLVFYEMGKHFCQTPDLGQGLEFDFTFAM